MKQLRIDTQQMIVKDDGSVPALVPASNAVEIKDLCTSAGTRPQPIYDGYPLGVPLGPYLTYCYLMVSLEG